MPMALIAAHDKTRYGTYRAVRANHQLVDIVPVRNQITGTVIKGMPMVISGIVGVFTCNNIKILNMDFYDFAFKRTFKEIFHFLAFKI